MQLFMIIQSLSSQKPFITRDGSQIRSLLDRTNAPVANQSLAEASVPEGGATERHYHKLSEEFYFLLEGRGTMEIDGKMSPVSPGDAILIPAGSWPKSRPFHRCGFCVVAHHPMRTKIRTLSECEGERRGLGGRSHSQGRA